MRKILLLSMLLHLSHFARAEDAPQQVIITAPQEAEWNSYRHAYKASAFYASYTRSRPLIQAHMQLRPLNNAPLTGLNVHLAGEKTSLDIAVDDMGRANIPLLKQAYDEDAVLRLNRPKGQFYFSGRYSIKENPGAQYSSGDLRAACEQLISAQRESGDRLRLLGKKCSGIKFVFALTDDKAGADMQDSHQRSHHLPVSTSHPFEDDSMGMYRVAIYRFADWPEQGIVKPATGLLAIGTLYE